MKYSSSPELSEAPRSSGDITERRSARGAVVAIRRWAFAVKSFAMIIACKGERTFHAGRFLFATEGGTFERSLNAFRAIPAGRDLLQRRPNVRAFYRNRAVLQACPEDSLGQRYAEFMKTYGLDEEFYFGLAVENGSRYADDPATEWYRIRVDAGHDIRHVLSGYGADVLGEVCLLMFRFGQTGHAGVFALMVLGVLNILISGRRPVLKPLIEAYQRGRRSGLLDLLPWEDGIALPLAAHRAALGLTPPVSYPGSFAPDSYVSLEGPACRD
jgi:ubiquinone biosynthesis protein COQ4